MLWGQARMHLIDHTPPLPFTAALIQPNIPQAQKWDTRFRDQILARYRTLTLEAAGERPDLIIWPEAATPGHLQSDRSLDEFVRSLSATIHIPLLVGSSSDAKIGRIGKQGYGRQPVKLKNSMFLFDATGHIIQAYHKRRLLPFAEYLPLAGHIPWPRWLVPKIGTFVSGKEPTIFILPHVQFGTVICWENFFSDLVRTLVQAGAQFVVNPTNEAWFGKTEGSHQFLAMSVFRAVENGVALLRAANTGISSLIDPAGRVVDRVRDAKGEEILVEGILTVSVPAPTGPTMFTLYGDWFAYGCATATGFFFLFCILPHGARPYPWPKTVQPLYDHDYE